MLTAATAFAQRAVTMQADIPFAFRVGETALPAGHYEVRSDITPGVLSLRCNASKAVVTITAHGVQAPKVRETGSLVFNQYNETYFLSRVWKPGDSQGKELPKSQEEREYARNNSPGSPAVEVALVRQ